MRRLVSAAFLGAILLLAGSGPSRAATSNCPADIRGSSGICSYICYLTAIAFYRDADGNIVYECQYDECDTFCRED